jgi:MerR family transcriptional regulator, aldehyde-responsive regulator
MLTIQEAARRTGMPTETIRAYEKAGMLPKLERDTYGWRSFAAQAIEWLVMLKLLRATGGLTRAATVSSQRAMYVSRAAPR